MKASDRLFPPDRSETAKAIMAGATRIKIDAATWGETFQIEYEIHGTIASDGSRRFIRDVLGQLEENAERDKDDDD